MNHIDQSYHILNWGVWKDPVSKIENMAGSPPYAIKNPPDFFLNEIDRAKENNRIEISLNGHIVTQTSPCFFKIHPPIDSNRLSSCPLHQLQKGGRIRCKVDE